MSRCEGAVEERVSLDESGTHQRAAVLAAMMIYRRPVGGPGGVAPDSVLCRSSINKVSHNNAERC